MKRTATIPGIIILTMATLAQPVPPVIIGASTNRVLTGEERRISEFEKARKEAEEAYQKKLADAKKKWEAATNRLGARHHIPGKNPFRLIKREIEKPQVRIVAQPAIRVPHLAGIVRIKGSARAVLRINPLRGGPAQYIFLEVGEIMDGVEVLKIDLKMNIVEVKIRNRTYSLELEKNTLTSFESDGGRPSGTSYRPGSSSRTTSGRPPSGSSSTSRRPSGSSSRNTSSKGTSNASGGDWRKRLEEARKAGGSRTSPKKPSGSSKGGLQGVPRRGGRK